MPRQQLDSADYKQRQARDFDETEGLQAWSSGKKTIENSPNDEFMRVVGNDAGPRQIPVSQALSDADKGDLEAGRAVIAIPHDSTLTDADKLAIQEGRAIHLPKPIPTNRMGDLTNDELSALASGRATISEPQAAAPAGFSKGPDGRVEVPGARLHEALDSGVASLEDIAAGRVKVL